MKGFAGFPAGKQTYTPLPDLFFSELLPDIDHLGELKVTLYVFWLLAHRKGAPPCVSGNELSTDQRFLEGLSSPAMTAQEVLRDGLERAVARGTLLRVFTGEEMDPCDWYLLNSEKGRQARDDLLAGRWLPVEAQRPLHLQAQRPNIFVLYEQNIGALTPLIKDELMDAESTYSPEWIEEAFRKAVNANVRKWSYVRSILERWSAEGRQDETSRRSDQEYWRRFVAGGHAE